MGLILIRHAQTDDSGQRYIGQQDICLNTTGRRQAELLVEALTDHALTGLLCSPLSRAIETAAPLVAARNLSLEIRPALMEICFGALEGQTKAGGGIRLRKDHLRTPIPGGESLWSLWQRLAPVEDELRMRMEQGDHIAVVGHYWSNRLLLGRLLKMPFEQAPRNRSYKPGNASAVLLTPCSDSHRLTDYRWLHPLQTPSLDRRPDKCPSG